MIPRIGLFHATINAVAPATAAWREAGVKASLQHYVDEGLLRRVNRCGLDDQARARFGEWLRLIAGDDVDAVLTTCSSLSPAVPALRPHVPRPVIAIDDAMLEEALTRGERLAVVATLPAAAATTRDLLSAAAGGRKANISTRVAEGAFAALGRGDFTAHDAAVADCVRAAAPFADVVVLAQLSMARVRPGLADLTVPVLTSASGAVARTLAAAQAASSRA